MRQRALDSTLSRRTVCLDSPTHTHTHVMRTPYEGGQGPCIWISILGERETGGDDTERPTSRKLTE